MKINLHKISEIIIVLYLIVSIFMGNYFFKVPTITKEIIFCGLILNIILISLKKRTLNKKIIRLVILVILLIIQVEMYKSPDIFAIRYYVFPYIIFYYVTTYIYIINIKNLKKFLEIYYWIICGVLIIQVLQKINLVLDLLKFFSLERLKLIRLYSFFSLPTLAGGTLVILGCFLILEKKSLFYYLNTLIFLILTYSRGSLFAFFVFTLGYIYFFHKKFFFKMIIPIIIIASVLILNLKLQINDESFLDRIGIIKKIEYKNIIFGNGVGFSNGRNIMGKKIFDNEYIRIFYEIGLLGMFICFNFFYKIWRNGNNKIKLLLLVYFILMLTMEIFTIYPIPIFIYLILGFFYKEEVKNYEKNTICNR